VHTDRGDLHAPLVVDALGWRRVLSSDPHPIQPPKATLSRGLEVHPPATSEDFELWIDPSYVRKGYSWSFPARDEVRIGVGSFEPRDHVREPTVRLSHDLGLPAEGFQGNWIPHALRRATGDGVFFVGDSAGHCLPATAEGIRPAFYFGLACGRELRLVVEGRQTREQALERYDAASEDKRYAYRGMLRAQRFVARATPYPLMTSVLELAGHPRSVRWAFEHYGDICPPPEPSTAGGGALRSRTIR
jgi:flavin-dependent dehydrogenase